MVLAHIQGFYKQLAVLPLLIVLVAMLPGTARAAAPAGPANPQETVSRNLPVYFNQDELKKLSRLEEALFLTVHAKDPPQERLARLEESVFGKARPSEPLAQRLTRLQQMVIPHQSPAAASQPEGGGPFPPLSPDPPTQPAQPQQTAGEKQADGTDYPSVTALEQEIFGAGYAQEDITRRLSRLENQVFGSPQRGALVDRVDQLQMSVFGSMAPPPPLENGRIPLPSDVYADGSTPTALAPSAQPPSYQSPQDPRMLSALTETELDVLGNTFPGEPVEIRLNRLESHIFHSTSPEMESGDRLMRVIAVAAADGDEPPQAPSKMKSTLQTLLPIIITILPLILL